MSGKNYELLGLKKYTPSRFDAAYTLIGSPSGNTRRELLASASECINRLPPEVRATFACYHLVEKIATRGDEFRIWHP